MILIKISLALKLSLIKLLMLLVQTPESSSRSTHQAAGNGGRGMSVHCINADRIKNDALSTNHSRASTSLSNHAAILQSLDTLCLGKGLSRSTHFSNSTTIVWHLTEILLMQID
ncbi:hypothetical protein PoB_003098200 [Plakobranchus ocellatus]|uniref:Secreted protein n=1 Tax=Plakobranchus ocellatus TaxID=259542 RepID=A0AAV4AB64_9GAST|nr:hypothetical protein PoB_003098200 [Plakobranchus ocellatus]